MGPRSRHFKVAFESDLFNPKVYDVHDLFNYLIRGMKFTFEPVFFPRHINKLLPNGTWTGLGGALNRSEVDFSVNPYKLSYGNQEVFSLSFPYDIDETVFVTTKPEYSPETMALFRTLSLNVWLSLLATTILFALVCYAWLKHRYTLEEILFHVLAIGLNQEGNLMPERAGGSLLLGTWMVGMALFTFCFKSVLLSFLTFPPLQGVSTVPELASAIRAGKYSAHTISGDISRIDLGMSQSEDIRTILESILKNPSVSSDDLDEKTLMETLRILPKKALICEKEFATMLEDVAYISKENLEFYFLSLATKKDFCCKEEMNMLIHRFTAAGLKQKIDRTLKYFFNFQLNFKEETNDVETIRKITLTDLSGAFILLIVGHCLSVCVLIIELRMKRRETRYSSAKKKKMLHH